LRTSIRSPFFWAHNMLNPHPRTSLRELNMIGKASVHPRWVEASQISTNRAAPIAKVANIKVRDLKDAIRAFGYPENATKDVPGQAFALQGKQEPEILRSRSQLFANVDTPCQCSLDMSMTCSTYDSSESFGDGSDSNCGISNLIPDAVVTTTGCGTFSQHFSQNGNQQVASQSVIAFNQQTRKPDAFLKSVGTITTFAIQNIPSNYTTAMLIQELNCQGFQGVYDYVYQPSDHQTRNKRPFAFVNFATPLIAKGFHLMFHGTFLSRSCGVEVPLSVLPARDQGVAANTVRYYTCKAQSRGRFRTRPINLPIDNKRVLEVDAYARKLLMATHHV